MLDILERNDYKVLIYSGLIASLILGLAALTWFGFRQYKLNRSRSSYQALIESIEEIDKAKTTIGQITWEEIIASLDEGAQRYSDTKLYPYFLVYKAEVLKNLNNIKESNETFHKAVKAMNDTDSELYGLYSIKESFIKLNSNNAELKEQGFNLLKELSQNKDINTRQTALYYLGYYNYLNNNFEDARNNWLELNKTGIKNSVWDMLIKQYMPNLIY